MHGKTYREIIDVSGFKIGYAIKVCQKDMGYAFNLMFSCVIELLAQYKPADRSDADWEMFLRDLSLFQQRIKYGLVNAAEIAAYEFGYADRIIARAIGGILSNETPNETVERYKIMIKNLKNEIKELLKMYPDYFNKVIQI